MEVTHDRSADLDRNTLDLPACDTVVERDLDAHRAADGRAA
jgi:hypothetical protein